MKRIIVIGAGFAGLWAALGAARKRQELSKNNDLEIIVINKTPYHDIRVRNYEEDLEATRIPLKKLLELVNIKLVVANVKQINPDKKEILVNTGSQKSRYIYDRLILAAGSQLYYPEIDGLKQHSFNIDTYDAAKALEIHLKQLPHSNHAKGRYTIAVVGGGFTGLELAAELPARITAIATADKVKAKVDIILIDHGEIANTLGKLPQSAILKALNEMGIKLMPNTSIKALKSDGILLESGEFIPTQTIIWTIGMQANPLTSLFTDAKDKTGRIMVDEFLCMPQTPYCFAAGDVACATVDANNHTSVMSCQHARPQGRISGHNAVANIYDLPMITYHQEAYVTCLDLGLWGALYMQGWERKIISSGNEAKTIKKYINHERIYPPLTKSAKDLLDAAAPAIQASPKDCFK